MRRESGRESGRRGTVRRIAGVGVVALALPLAACATPAAEARQPDLLRAGCPADIRIATDAAPGVAWGFLYGMLDPDETRVHGGAVTGPLVVDGEHTGVRLTILTGDPLDDHRANVALHRDEGILLGAVDTDVAILDADRYPTVGVFAPLESDPRLIYWDAEAYPGLRNVESIGGRLSPDGSQLAPAALAPGDPFTGYALGMGWLKEEQLVVDPELTVAAFVAANGLRMQAGDDLVDPYLLAAADGFPGEAASQVLSTIGYGRDTLLAARPQALVRYADCLHVLVPSLQRALADYLDDPMATNELLVSVAAELGHPEYDAAFVAWSFRRMLTGGYAGEGRDDTIGDVDLGHVRSLFGRVVGEWRDVGLDVPDVVAEDIVTNGFIDRTIGER